MQVEKSLRTQQAAEYLLNNYDIPISPGTMEVWRSYGRGPRYRKIARWVVYTPADLDIFASGRVVETTDSNSKE